MKNKRLLFVLLISCFAFFNCFRNEDNIGKDSVNNFVWRAMNSWYYWQKKAPNLSDNIVKNKSSYYAFLNNYETKDFFYNLLYKYQEVDRFSWIVPNLDELLKQFSGISKSSGMDLNLTRIGEGNEVLAVVNYVVPNSPAASAGIKRGSVITEVNGSMLNTSNYRALFSDNFSVSYFEALQLKNKELFPVGDKKQANIQSVELSENPVAFSKVFNVGGKKIGYLVYNGFKANYNKDLNEAFLKLKSQGITDLILDLRYNGGGDVSTAVALGQMITGNHTGEPYVYLDFNEKHSTFNETYRLADKMNVYDFVDGTNQKVGEQNINSLNLNKIYILTSHGTASASELTITGLKPYIDVVTIGEETYGKFVGSITLVDNIETGYLLPRKITKKFTWAMQPIVFAYYNARRDPQPQGGVKPNFEIDPFEYYLGMKEFGNVDADPALKKAYDLITGNASRVKTKKIPKINTEFIGSTSTLKPFGTEVYLNNDVLN